MSRSFTPTYRVAAAIGRGLMRLVTRPTWLGLEKLPPSGGYLVVGNHVSNADGLTLMHMLLAQQIPVKILAKHELFKVPVLGWLLKRTGQVPVYRGSARATEALTSARAALESGEVVALFPEGTLTRSPRMWPMTAKTGAARLALATNVPVIPVGQWGAHALHRRAGGMVRFWRRPRVAALVGEPVDLSAWHGRTDKEAYQEASVAIMAAITKLVEELRGQPAPEQVWDMRTDGDHLDTPPDLDRGWQPRPIVVAPRPLGDNPPSELSA
ncbi:lysophospholipid acyltransferase family protein [Buchananella hordeovulneris]|uniref:lysophospholipid acyltransferase family protein n=1 Tax=Buchananella hordeovulneris TaxID=52770 RepID=UPI0026DB266B|nr:lysophospholipid acyltransferase family protein [Buchananella hordeovulneris]MDO5081252.1 lysophospholipid acyltransferase family protein [Buchananella hordeovulneris]